jgi:tetratricopeptide (TPR) repeat protein
MNRNRQQTSLICLACLGLALALLLSRTSRFAEDPELIYEQALALVEAEQFDQAESVMQRLRKSRLPTVLDHGLQARVDIAKGRVDQAIDNLSVIPDDHPLAGWARLRCGQLERSRMRFRKAENWLQETLRIDENSVEARRELVYVYGMQLRRSVLHDQFRKLNRLTTLKAKEIWVWCMVRDLAWWHPEEHIPILERAIGVDAEDYWSRIALAEVLRRQGHTDQAMLMLEQSPVDRIELLAKRLELLLDQQDLEQVQKSLEKIPLNEPNVATLRGRLAMSNGDTKSALKFFELSEEFESGKREVIANLGQALIQAGDQKKGKIYLQKAGQIDKLNNMLLQLEKTIESSGVETWRTLGSTCESADRLAEARAWQSLIIANNPFDQIAQTAVFRIDEKMKAP